MDGLQMDDSPFLELEPKPQQSTYTSTCKVDRLLPYTFLTSIGVACAGKCNIGNSICQFRQTGKAWRQKLSFIRTLRLRCNRPARTLPFCSHSFFVLHLLHRTTPTMVVGWRRSTTRTTLVREDVRVHIVGAILAPNRRTGNRTSSFRNTRSFRTICRRRSLSMQHTCSFVLALGVVIPKRKSHR